MRRTKIICTIGPKTCRYEEILKLAQNGMNVARLNMSYGNFAWHQQAIKAIKTINEKGEYSIAILLDTKGAETRSGDLKKEIILHPGERFVFTIRREAEYPSDTVEVSYDGFINDVVIGDTILVDGGMLSFLVKEKTASDIICETVDGGILTSRRHLNIRGKTSRAPTITRKDWQDIDFGIKAGVDFIALSYAKEARAVKKLKEYLVSQRASIDVIAKIESAAALAKLAEIVEASDGVMVARGDLGAEVPVEDIPLIQEEIVGYCRVANKPVIIATHLLESMIVYPTPTRAEVADIAQAVRQHADAIMLSGETASGKYPFIVLSTMDRIASHIEKKLMLNQRIAAETTQDPKKEITTSAAMIASNLNSRAILVFTRRGYMATLLSRCRPNPVVFAFTNTTTVRRRLNLYWGLIPFRIEFSRDPEKTVKRAIMLLKSKNLINMGETVVIVSDILVGSEFVETIQLRVIKE